MKAKFNNIWLLIAVLLSLIFIILFFPHALENYDDFESILFTLAGLLVIWIIYFIRARIFTSRKH